MELGVICPCPNIAPSQQRVNINIHITENVPGKRFYLWSLQSDHNEIWHEYGPLDPNYRKTTLVWLPWQQLPW